MRLDARALKAALGLAALAVLLAALFLGLRAWEAGLEAPSGAADPPLDEREDGRELTFYDGAWYAPREGLETVLILGLDRSAEDGSILSYGNYAQADFQLLLIIDREKQTYTPLHLNRDTMAEITEFDRSGNQAGSSAAQLALAYARAQAYTGDEKAARQAAMEAVSGVLFSAEIDHCVTLTMDGLMMLNDLAGGVEVEIRDDFSAIDEQLVQGETVNLLGRHALNFVRTRWRVGDNSNLERMERQEQYLEALTEKLTSLAEEDEDFVLSALLELNSYLGSDCTLGQLADLAETLRAFDRAPSRSLEGEAVMGEQYIEFYPDQRKLEKLVVEVFYEKVDER